MAFIPAVGRVEKGRKVCPCEYYPKLAIVARRPKSYPKSREFFTCRRECRMYLSSCHTQALALLLQMRRRKRQPAAKRVWVYNILRVREVEAQEGAALTQSKVITC